MNMQDMKLGSYNPLGFLIELSDTIVKVESLTDRKTLKVIFSENGQTTLWHEYTHFIQAVSTIAGVGELLNWFDIQIDIAKDRVQVLNGGVNSYNSNPDLFPNLKDSLEIRKKALNFYYFREKWDIKFSAPPEIRPFDLYRDGNYDGIPSIWLTIPFSNETKVIRITRAIFSEGMARAIGDLVRNQENPITKIELSNQQIVYYALRAYSQNHFPEIDSRLSTIVIADACLFSKKPFEVLEKINESIKHIASKERIINLIQSEQSIEIAKYYNKNFEEDIDEINSFLDERIRKMENALKSEPGYFISNLWKYIKEILNKRIQSDKPLECLLNNKSWESFCNVSKKYGCPIVFVKDEMLPFEYKKDFIESLRCFLAGTEIIRKIFFHESSPCRFYKSPSCKHPPKGRKCKSDIVNIPTDSNGNACFVSHVAAIMNLRKI